MIEVLLLSPLLGFVINALFGRHLPRNLAMAIGCLSVFVSFVCAVLLGVGFIWGGQAVADTYFLYSWIEAAELSVPIEFQIDALSACMILLVSGVGFLIHLFSVDYMHEDPLVHRYFAYINLFIFFMLILVLAKNLVLLFVGWEGVGLCSYLLIGFWFSDPQKAYAGKKAFVVNRVGDAGLLLGFFLLFQAFHTLDIPTILQRAMDVSPTVPTTMLTLATLCLLLGVCGKSAQAPLYIWLPDAMAGPTPVSALIHAATMVTAGIYLFCRLSMLLLLAPLTATVLLCVGGITTLVGALLATAQKDIKKVLAYSTVSQLGYMVMALGVGAFTAAFFHLLTHAFFKALLFLGAGAVIHGLHHEQDMEKMGGLKSKMPVVAVTMGLATLAIAGVPPLAGFFSKDAILVALFQDQLNLVPLGLSRFMFVLGVVTALITAYYMTRLFALTFLGTYRGHAHPHEAPLLMKGVLVVLAVGAMAGGLLDLPHGLGHGWLSARLQPVFQLPEDHHALSLGIELSLMGLSVGAAVLGIWFAYRRTVLMKMAIQDASFTWTRVCLNAFYVDAWYDRLVVKPLAALAYVFKFLDQFVIDGFLKLLSVLSFWLGDLGQAWQSRRVKDGIAWMALGALLFVASLCGMLLK